MFVCYPFQEHHKRPISKDSWDLMLDFVENIKSDFSNYDEEGKHT